MNKNIIFIIFGVLLFIISADILFYYKNYKIQPVLHSTSQIDKKAFEQADLKEVEKKLQLASPINDFANKITKKPFGIYITPENSPIQPEHFSGYHTGVDVEYDDQTSDVPVFSIADGEIVFKDYVSGYGGTMVIKYNINGEDLYALYGHLRQQSFTNNQNIKKGEQIAFLGQGHSSETDGERKHLHFAIKKGSQDLRGYVSNQSELSGWYNPLDFYQKINQN